MSTGHTTTKSGTFTFTSWEEKRPDEHTPRGPRTAHARTTNDFQGLIVGSSVADHVMYYSGREGDWGGPGTYHGYEQITGAIDGRTGSFVLEHHGSYEGVTVRADWSVVPGSGTGELTGLSGSGGFVSSHGDPATAYTFDYAID